MIIDTNKIKNLLNEETAYSIEAETGISRAGLRNYFNNEDKFKRMSLEKANTLQNYYDYLKGAKNMYKLTVKEESDIQTVEFFETFDKLKNHLIEEDYFSWINDEEPEKELPNFENVEVVGDINNILEEYNYGWWTMEIKENKEETKMKFENLNAVHFDSGEYELEFLINGEKEYITVNASDHPEAEHDENYFDDKKIVNEIVKENA